MISSHFKRVLFALLCAGCISYASAATEVLFETFTESKIARVFHEIEPTLPAAELVVEFSIEETAAFSDFFSGSQPHAAITQNKLVSLNTLTDILTHRKNTNVLLKFHVDTVTTRELHLCFTFNTEFYQGKNIQRLILTVTTTKAIIEIEKEFLHTLIKADSFLTLHGMKVLALLGIGAAVSPFTIPAYLRYTRRNPDWTSTLKTSLEREFTAVHAYKDEYAIDIMQTYPTKPYVPALQSVYDSTWPIFEPERVSIPEKPLVYILCLPCAGALSALAKAGKLGGNIDKKQVRILLYPASHASAVKAEIESNLNTLKANNWIYLAINENNSQKIQESNAKTVLKQVTTALSVPLDASIHNWANYEKQDIHVRYLENITNRYPTWAVTYPNDWGSSWQTKGTTQATREIVVLPVSMLHLDTITPANIPNRGAKTKRSLLLIINDDHEFLYRDRAKLSPFITMKRDLKTTSPLRFDNVCVILDAAVSKPQQRVHYATPKPTTSDFDPSSVELNVFEATDDTTALALVYAAAENYLKFLTLEIDAQIIKEREENIRRNKQAAEQLRQRVRTIQTRITDAVPDFLFRFPDQSKAQINIKTFNILGYVNKDIQVCDNGSECWDAIQPHHDTTIEVIMLPISSLFWLAGPTSGIQALISLIDMSVGMKYYFGQHDEAIRLLIATKPNLFELIIKAFSIPEKDLPIEKSVLWLFDDMDATRPTDDSDDFVALLATHLKTSEHLLKLASTTRFNDFILTLAPGAHGRFTYFTPDALGGVQTTGDVNTCVENYLRSVQANPIRIPPQPRIPRADHTPEQDRATGGRKTSPQLPRRDLSPSPKKFVTQDTSGLRYPQHLDENIGSICFTAKNIQELETLWATIQKEDSGKVVHYVWLERDLQLTENPATLFEHLGIMGTPSDKKTESLWKSLVLIRKTDSTCLVTTHNMKPQNMLPHDYGKMFDEITLERRAMLSV